VLVTLVGPESPSYAFSGPSFSYAQRRAVTLYGRGALSKENRPAGEKVLEEAYQLVWSREYQRAGYTTAYTMQSEVTRIAIHCARV
jgi:hypothetical protein